MTKKRFFFLGLILLSILLGVWYGIREIQYKDLLKEKAFLSSSATLREVAIPKGASLNHVAGLLRKAQVIESEQAFQRYTEEQNKSALLQAGAYTIPNHLTIPEVLQYLTGEVKSQEIRFTIPEGTTLEGIATLYEKKGLGSKKEFISCAETCTFPAHLQKMFPSQKKPFARYRLEGYLFPDTYFLPTEGSTPEKVLTLLLTTFKKRIYNSYNTESTYDFYDTLTMASILERETRPKDDIPLVAGILWKRLENNVQLAADATTVYMKNSDEALTYKDLRSSNPYNTRINKGLPPTPISNPGIQTFLAAMKPTSSSYWYYLHDNNGIIHFAETERSHDQNKRLYLSQ